MIRKKSSWDLWPGFVDALTTLLMVMIFVLMVFVLSQVYLAHSLTKKEDHLKKTIQSLELTQQDLTQKERDNLSLQEKYHFLVEKVNELTQLMSGLKETHENTKIDLETALEEKEELSQKNSLLSKKIKELLEEIKTLSSKLSTTETLHTKAQEHVEELKKNIASLQNSSDETYKTNSSLSEENISLKDALEQLKKQLAIFKENQKLQEYQSEFLSNLKSVIGNQPGIRVVGDRFIFQSEILFDKGSAILGEEGKQQLIHLSNVLKKIIKKIPAQINWILRVDGHTDHLPIKTAQFPSNLELSSARAITVVHFLETHGIPANRLVAAGFGEHQPLATGKDEQQLSKNRRIEFKLDQK